VHVVAPDVVGDIAGSAHPDLVPRKGHSHAIYGAEHGHVIVGVAGGVEDLELVLLPGERLPLFQAPFYRDGSGERATELVAVWMFQNVHHVFVAPDAGAVVLLQIGQSVDVVVVVMAGQRQVDLDNAKSVAQQVQVVLLHPQSIASLEVDV